MMSGERQAARMRCLYLKSILRQDIAFFDQEVESGEVVVGRMSGDALLIQDAVGEKVGKLVQLMATFFGGFLIAFTKEWLLTLVMLSSCRGYVSNCHQDGVSCSERVRCSCRCGRQNHTRHHNCQCLTCYAHHYFHRESDLIN